MSLATSNQCASIQSSEINRSWNFFLRLDPSHFKVAFHWWDALNTRLWVGIHGEGIWWERSVWKSFVWLTCFAWTTSIWALRTRFSSCSRADSASSKADCSSSFSTLKTALTEQTFDSYVKVATSIVCALDSHHYQRSCLNLDHTRTFCKNEKALIFFCAINNNSCHNVTTVLQFTTPNSMQCHWPLLKMNKPCTWSLLLCLSSSWIDLPPSPSWSRRSLISSPRFLFSLLTLSNCSTVSSQAVSRRNIRHHQYDDSLIITFDVKPGAFIEMIN